MLQATDSSAVRSVEVVHEGIAAAEVQAAWVRSTCRTTPIVTVRADTVENGVPGARQRPLERGGKSTSTVVTTPTQALVIKFRFGRYAITTRARVIYAVHPLP